MRRQRIAVVGAGHLGKIHAQLLAELPQVELTAVIDPSDQARAIAANLGAKSFSRIEDAFSEMDAAVLAAPTSLHFPLGMQLLEQGIHTLIEKPLAPTVDECESLMEAAYANQCVLQVGHVERFNPAVLAAAPLVDQPRYIEAKRTSRFGFRCLDVGVVMDLMIHDIDLVLNWTDAPLVDVQAIGDTLMDVHEDFAQARLTFADGCVASLTASRIAHQPQRTMEVHGAESHVILDFSERSVQAMRQTAEIARREFRASDLDSAERSIFTDRLFEDYLVYKSVPVTACNPLQDEQRDFVAAIRLKRTPRVTGEQARDAIAIAQRVLDAIDANQTVQPAETAFPILHIPKAA